MNRIIKFRAWDNGKMHKVSFNNLSCNNNHPSGQLILRDEIKPGGKSYETILMQFTGLKDKNGVEIYEGDIVRREEPDEDSAMGNTFITVGEVVYGTNPKGSKFSDYPTSFCLYNKEFYGEHALIYRLGAELEVIGNIYENPELIK